MRVPDIEYVILSTRGDVDHARDADEAHRAAVRLAAAPKTAGERKRAVRVYHAIAEYDIGGHGRLVTWSVDGMLAEIDAGRATVDYVAEKLRISPYTVDELLIARERAGT